MSKRHQRTEVERQALIRELRRLRDAGVKADRQDVIGDELRETFELGWPVPPNETARRKRRNGQVGA
jgi:hypothetical protein